MTNDGEVRCAYCNDIFMPNQRVHIENRRKQRARFYHAECWRNIERQRRYLEEEDWEPGDGYR